MTGGIDMRATPQERDTPDTVPATGAVSDEMVLPSSPDASPDSSRRNPVPLSIQSLRRRWPKPGAASRAEADGDAFIANAVRALAGGSYTVAVVGAKGGVGATTIALLAGALLAEVPEARPALVELAADWGGIGGLLGDTGSRTVVDLLAYLTAAHSAGLGFIQGFMTPWAHLPVLLAPHAPGFAARLTVTDYERTLHLLRTHYNLVLLDCGPSLIHPPTRFALDIADHVMLVTNPDPVALRRAHRAVYYLTGPPHTFNSASCTTDTGTRAHALTDITMVFNDTGVASVHAFDHPAWKEVMPHLNTLAPFPHLPSVSHPSALSTLSVKTLPPPHRRALKTLLTAVLGRLAYP